MARTVDAVKAREWRERVNRWRKAGLSVAEFCRREGVSGPLFHRWRRRLATLDEAGRACTPRFVELPAVPARLEELPADAARLGELPAVPARLGELPAVPARFGEPPAVQARLGELPAAGVQVALPGGAVVMLPGQASLDLVAAVVRAAMLTPGEGERC